MSEKIAAIRKLLDELEAESRPEAEEAFQKGFSAFELPDIIQDVVDFLMPLLSPYEAAFYWYMFRHSVVATGTQDIRLGNSKLQGIISTHSKVRDATGTTSAYQVRRVLSSMETKGVIRKDGEPNKAGTLYHLMIPEEIEGCRILMQECQKSEIKPVVTEEEVDYYNVRENRLQIYERDEYKCRYCGKQLTRFTATLDHIVAVANGGENTYENLITACLLCNSQKNRRPVGDFLADTNSSKS
jgi:hypothetical protein